jgi:hypothetical protein
MKNFKKKLVIDTDIDSEAEDLEHIITTESNGINLMDVELPVSTENVGDSILQQMVNFMEGENNGQDLSFKW